MRSETRGALVVSLLLSVANTTAGAETSWQRFVRSRASKAPVACGRSMPNGDEGFRRGLSRARDLDAEVDDSAAMRRERVNSPSEVGDQRGVHRGLAAAAGVGVLGIRGVWFAANGDQPAGAQELVEEGGNVSGRLAPRVQAAAFLPAPGGRRSGGIWQKRGPFGGSGQRARALLCGIGPPGKIRI